MQIVSGSIIHISSFVLDGTSIFVFTLMKKNLRGSGPDEVYDGLFVAKVNWSLGIRLASLKQGEWIDVGVADAEVPIAGRASMHRQFDVVTIAPAAFTGGSDAPRSVPHRQG